MVLAYGAPVGAEILAPLGVDPVDDDDDDDGGESRWR